MESAVAKHETLVGRTCLRRLAVKSTKPQSRLGEIWGRERCTGAAAVRLSRFNQYAPDYPASGQTLIHNTLAGSFAIVESAELALLQQVDKGELPESRALALVEEQELSDTNVGIVVASLADEDAEFAQWFEMQRSQTQLMEVTVGLNLACNFDCPYCCQAEVMDGSVMTERTARSSAAWIAQRATSEGVEAVHLVFVGGEPLLHPGRLELVAQGVKEGLQDSGVAFSFGLLTNAYFLNDEMIARLVPQGLTKAQITLDGDVSTHALSRVSKKGENTFERVFENAIRAARQIEVSINGNYQAETLHGFVPLLDQLKASGFSQGSSIKFGPALGGLSAPVDATHLAPTWSSSQAEYQMAFFDEITRRGYRATSPGTVGPCEFHERQAFAIGPRGTLFKCPGFLGEEAWGIGHVETGLTARYEEMLTATPQSHCDGCGHRPNCGGGCVAAAMMKSGELRGVSCEKPFFERNARDAVCRSYKLAIAESPAEAAQHFPAPRVALPLQDSVPVTVSGGRRSSALRVL